MPKVSIVMPSYNVAPYIRECMDSVVNQSMADIEIIVVDAFSTDGTREILQEYAVNDSRITILDDNKGSTGYSNNKAIDLATGEYVGIVETDDFVSLDMYEKLYNIAKENNCDIVKGDYESFSGNGDERLYVHHNILGHPEKYEKVLHPIDDQNIFDAIMFNWAGIYRRDFLQKYNIRHQETPGAAFQDNGFYAQVYILADRVWFTHQSFYRYRKDNPNSSINNPKKVFCMCDEYDFAENKLSRYPERLQKFYPRLLRRRYGACAWTLKKVAPQYREELTKRIYDDFKARIPDINQVKNIQPTVKYQKEMTLLLTDEKKFLANLISSQNQYDENIKTLCKRLRKYNTIVIFGAGEEGNVLRDLLAQNDIDVACIVDNDKKKWGKEVNKTKVMSLDKSMKMYPNALYVIAMRRHVREVRKQLEENNINKDKIFTYQSWRYIWD